MESTGWSPDDLIGTVLGYPPEHLASGVVVQHHSRCRFRDTATATCEHCKLRFYGVAGGVRGPGFGSAREAAAHMETECQRLSKTERARASNRQTLERIYSDAQMSDTPISIQHVVSLVPRILLRRVEAAEALGMSLTHFERYVQRDLALVRRGRLRLVPVGELERWAKKNATRL